MPATTAYLVYPARNQATVGTVARSRVSTAMSEVSGVQGAAAHREKAEPAGAKTSAETPAVAKGTTGRTISAQSREELSVFISSSVLPQTGKVYKRNWQLWTEFVRGETGGGDPYLTGMSEEDKAALVSLMMLRRHQGGKRGKGASAFTAAIRYWFARKVISTTFLDAAIIATARTSCLMKPEELRAKKDEGLSSTVKLPVCESILLDMMKRLWIEGDWSDQAKKRKAVYVASMYGRVC
jgi:hypothetical protein